MGNFPKVKIKVGDITLEGWNDTEKGLMHLEGAVSIKIEVSQATETRIPPSKHKTRHQS